MAITKERIFELAEELQATGQVPTLAAVRKSIVAAGRKASIGSGSYTTISEAMTEWKTKGAPLREPAPPALTEGAAELWALALDLANRKLATKRESLDIARVQLEAEKREVAELADQVTGELETLQSKLAVAEARLEETGKRAADLNAELARVNSQNAELLKALAAHQPDTPTARN